MKPLEIMNAPIKILLALTFCSCLSFSQQKQDVYFLIDEKNPKYIIPGIFNKSFNHINIFEREKYQYHLKSVKEAKKNGTYEYNSESGRDNLKIKVPTLTFKVISISEIKLSDCELKKLKLIDYDWLNKNSWKKIGKQPYNFKDIYFLYHTSKNEYISYKVDLTIVEY